MFGELATRGQATRHLRPLMCLAAMSESVLVLVLVIGRPEH